MSTEGNGEDQSPSSMMKLQKQSPHNASERFGNTDFFVPEDGVVSNPANKKVGRGIINSSVHTDLTYDFLDLPLLEAVFNHLMLKFRGVNREAQIQVWLSFFNMDPGKYNTTANLHKACSNTGKIFCKQGLSLNWDEILGLIIQNNLRRILWKSLDQEIDLVMEAHDHRFLSSQDDLQFLDATQTKQCLNDSPGITETNSLRTTLASRDYSSFSGLTSSISRTSIPESLDWNHIELNAP
ncbi:hypothetical protein VP01_343g4 [Puccinia sorghi]|uniref:Uncharacterized protein n=1 Tax=Puccinia sorghi TaxID=27349 RepID=A0A0L6UX59_9BASI|nr:hypothetical protein VP01_343g4 [Puccinia sorghi]